MSANLGHQNESDIIAVLNGTNIAKLPRHFREFIERLFGTDQGVLDVHKPNNEQKGDIGITLKGVTKYISIKSGDSNSFHSEHISTFIPFLRSIGINETTLKTIVLFHYGDNTLNGTGPIRFSSQQLRRFYHDRFERASLELSQPSKLAPIIDRCVTRGRFPSNQLIAGIYHGTIASGFFIATNQINQILLRTTHRRKNGTINMGMLTYQPGSRNLWGIPGSEQKREQSEIRWRSFIKDAQAQLRFGSDL